MKCLHLFNLLDSESETSDSNVTIEMSRTCDAEDVDEEVTRPVPQTMASAVVPPPLKNGCRPSPINKVIAFFLCYYFFKLFTSWKHFNSFRFFFVHFQKKKAFENQAELLQPPPPSLQLNQVGCGSRSVTFICTNIDLISIFFYFSIERRTTTSPLVQPT